MYSEISNNVNNSDKEKKPMIREAYNPPWFEEYLPFQYSGRRMPQNIKQFRNVGIAACFCHIISSFTGLSFYFIRRNILLIIFNLLSASLASIGTYGVIKMNKMMITIHGAVTSGILGSIFFYSLVESYFNENLNIKKDDLSLSESNIIFLLSIPYLVDFFTGLSTFYLSYLIYSHEEQIEEKKENSHLPELPNVDGGENCVICETEKKNSIFYKCGHKVVCSFCAKNLKDKYQAKCPICRAAIIDIIQEYQ